MARCSNAPRFIRCGVLLGVCGVHQFMVDQTGQDADRWRRRLRHDVLGFHGGDLVRHGGRIRSGIVSLAETDRPRLGTRRRNGNDHHRTCSCLHDRWRMAISNHSRASWFLQCHLSHSTHRVDAGSLPRQQTWEIAIHSESPKLHRWHNRVRVNQHLRSRHKGLRDFC